MPITRVGTHRVHRLRAARRTSRALRVAPGFDSRERIAENLAALLAQVPGAALTLLQHDAGPPALVLPESFRVAPLDIAALDPTDAPPLGRTTPDEIVHLQSTSGSTGTPRLTALTSANVLANTSSALERMEIDVSDRFVSWLPLFHDLGLVGMALDTLVAGADLFMLSPFDFAKNPFGWLKTVSDVGGTITATPNFGLTLAMRRVSDTQMQSLDLSSLRRLYCGAEPIDGRLAAQFIDRFARAGLPRDAVRPTYGLAEATLMVAMPTMNERAQYVTLDARDVARVDRVQVTRSGNISDLLVEPAADGEAIVVSVGQPGPGTLVRIVDENNKLVDEDQRCGEIVVAGPSVTPGYLLPDGSIEQFDPLGLRTGDVGFWYRGDLFVVERIKNTIIRNGHNYAPNVLELELARRSDIPIGDIAIIDSDLRPGYGRIVAAICLPKGRTTHQRHRGRDRHGPHGRAAARGSRVPAAHGDAPHHLGQEALPRTPGHHRRPHRRARRRPCAARCVVGARRPRHRTDTPSVRRPVTRSARHRPHRQALQGATHHRGRRRGPATSTWSSPTTHASSRTSTSTRSRCTRSR